MVLFDTTLAPPHTPPSFRSLTALSAGCTWCAQGETICDAGCGVGSLAIPMAQLGAKVRTTLLPCFSSVVSILSPHH